MENKFTDRIGNIVVSNGIVRLDCLTLSEVIQETNQHKFEVDFRLNIPVSGIMQAIEVLEKMKVDLLAQQGQQVAQGTPAEIANTSQPVEQHQPQQLAKEAFNDLTPEQREEHKRRAKLAEQERIQQQLSK